jgi:ABC-type transport system substrate-binding protein
MISVLGFNQRGEAPSARANGGVSIFSDIRVRMALTQAFDRCAARRAEFGVRTCTDPTYHTDELTALPAPDYDPTFALPAYNPTAAAVLLNQAGFPVVAGVRRFKDGTTPLLLLISLSGGNAPYVGMVHRLHQDYARNLHITVQIEQPLGQLNDKGVTGAFDIGPLFEGQVPGLATAATPVLACAASSASSAGVKVSNRSAPTRASHSFTARLWARESTG